MADRQALLRAYQTGQLLQAVREARSLDQIKQRELRTDLTELHNNGQIDLIEVFSGLQRRSSCSHDFHLHVRVFEELLPELNAPALNTVTCVQHLRREAGADGVGDTILDAFQGFCAERADRVETALAEIEASPDDLSDLLAPVLVAGSKIDLAAYVAQTIRLARDTNLELRGGALFALGRLDWGQALCANEDVTATIECSVETEDDEVLANVIKSAAVLSRLDAKREPRLTSAIAAALSKGGELALHAASQVFGFQTRELSRTLLDLLVERLARVQPANLRLLQKIDLGVAHLLRDGDASKGLKLLEGLPATRPARATRDRLDRVGRTAEGVVHQLLRTRQCHPEVAETDRLRCGDSRSPKRPRCDDSP